jgi:cellobiose transport system permease protein
MAVSVRRRLVPYLYIAPFFILFAVFGVYTILYTAILSLYRVPLTDPSHRTWVGLQNYVDLWADAQFHKALFNTLVIAVLSTVPQLLLALGLAYLLNRRLAGRTFFRVGILLPYATSVAAAALVFAQLFGRDHGLINWVLGTFGVGPISWEPGLWTSKIAISVIIIWRWTGYNALIYLAGMQNIPADLYESAALDGAGRWHQFRYITIPALRPTIIFTVVVSTIFSLQIFGEPRLFAGSGDLGIQGGASNQYQTLALLLYQQGWSNGALGRASATAWSMFLIIILLTAVNGLLVSGKLRRNIGRGGRQS